MCITRMFNRNRIHTLVIQCVQQNHQTAARDVHHMTSVKSMSSVAVRGISA